MIGAEKLEYGEIISALEKGSFYASTGAYIYSIVEDGGVVKVKTSNAKKITLLTNTRRVGGVVAQEGESVCEAEFKLHELDSFFRIKVEDEKGKKAWSQAYEV